MWCLVVINVIAVIQSAQGGYEYPKPSIPFELPNQALQDNSGNILKRDNIDHETVSYSLPYDDYQYLLQYKNKENQLSLESTDESIQQNFGTGIKQDQTHFLPTQLNTNKDTTVPVQSAASQSSAIKSSLINVQPILSANSPQLILNIKNNVPPLVNLQNSEYVQQLQDNSEVELLDIHNANVNVPPLIKLNTNQVSSINQNILQQSSNIPYAEQQLNYHSNNVEHSPSSSSQNVNNVIEIIESPIINLQESLPLVLNPQNNVPANSILSDVNIEKQVANLNIRGNHLLFSNVNDELAKPLNIQNLQTESIGQVNSENIVTPVVTKSISFHVPPPDIEETPIVPTVLPHKKTYKIIFIKTPTHENQYRQQLQTAFYSRLAPVEDKTIIYVISKKPDVLPEQVALPQPTKVSEHEVLFVQYKDQRTNPAQENINENITQLPLNFAIDAGLDPSFLNSH